MTIQEVRDINDIINTKLNELWPGDDNSSWKLVFRDGEFLGVEVGKCFLEADQFDLAFV